MNIWELFGIYLNTILRDLRKRNTDEWYSCLGSVTFTIINPIFIPYKLQMFFIYVFHFEAFNLHFLFTLMSFCRLLGQSIVLISVLEVVGNIIGCSHKVVENITVLWVVIQVLLGSSQRLELLNGEVVVGDLGESEWLFVDSKGVHLHWYFFVLISFNLLFNLHRRFEVLLIKGHWELV